MRLAAALIAVLATAAIAHAGPWTAPALLKPNDPAACDRPGPSQLTCSVEPATQVAVNTRGETLVAWANGDFDVYTAYARRGGRFGAARKVGSGLRPAIVLRADGSAVVAWAASHQVRFARARSAGRFGPSQPVAPTRKHDEDDYVRLLPRPDGTTTAVFEHAVRRGYSTTSSEIRAVEIPAAGPAGAPATLGTGDVESAAVSAGGGQAVCCLDDGLLARAPQTTTWETVPQPPGARVAVWSIAVDDHSLLVGIVDDNAGGDAGAQGRPGVAVGAFGEPLGEVRFAPVDKITRGLEPVVTFDGQGRTVLAYQEKARPEGFSREAPVYVVSAPAGRDLGPRIRLDRGQALEPLVAPLPNGAVIAWSKNERWNAATLRHGVLHRVRAPSGGPGDLHDAATNRALATAGHYAALAWETSRGAIRASVARYP